MRVVHVISSLDPSTGGALSALVGLCKAQHDIGIEVEVLATVRRGDNLELFDQMRRHGISGKVIGQGMGPLVWHPRIGSVLAAHIGKAQVVHIHALWEEIQHQAARCCQRMGRPYVISPHGMLVPLFLGQSRVKKRLYLAWRLRRDLNRAGALHFTAATERRLTAPVGLRAPALVEANGLDMSEFAKLPEPGCFRRRFAGVGDRPMVLFLSRLHPKKGLDLLVPAFADAGTGDAVLVIAGPAEGDYRQRVEAMVGKQGLVDRVIFTGMLRGRERLEAMVDADLFVLASYQESFGIVIAESLACGTPVIISDQVNICDEIASGGVGEVVPTAVAPLAEALGRWLNDDELRSAAGGRARDFVAQRYDWQQIAGRWQGHYQQVVAGTLGK